MRVCVCPFPGTVALRVDAVRGYAVWQESAVCELSSGFCPGLLLHTIATNHRWQCVVMCWCLHSEQEGFVHLFSLERYEGQDITISYVYCASEVCMCSVYCT